MSDKEMIKVKLDDGTIIYIETNDIDGGEEEISTKEKFLPFKNVKLSIISISKEISEALQKVQPDKASVKFGLEVGVETGNIFTLITKGSASANLEITLEWNKSKAQ